MASNKAKADWWTEVPKDLELHDKIWFNAIRVLLSVESRSTSKVADLCQSAIFHVEIFALFNQLDHIHFVF